jgi:hypothetical protein
MMTPLIVPVGAGEAPILDDAILSLASAACLVRFKGLSREHTHSDLRTFVGWCVELGIEPLGADRRRPELNVRLMQESRWQSR